MELPWKSLPLLLSFLQLFLFPPVGYYFLTRFDNYFINQERLNKSLKIQLSELLEPAHLWYSDLGELYNRCPETKGPTPCPEPLQYRPSSHLTHLGLGQGQRTPVSSGQAS